MLVKWFACIFGALWPFLAHAIEPVGDEVLGAERVDSGLATDGMAVVPDPKMEKTKETPDIPRDRNLENRLPPEGPFWFWGAREIKL